jgi:hypothetical protein
MAVQDQQNGHSPLTLSALGDRLLGAVAVVAAGLWVAAGLLASRLDEQPIPAYFNLILVAAATLSVITVFVALTYNGRRGYGQRFDRLIEELEALREQQRQRDAAWSTVNALLGDTNSNLRVLPARTERN